MFVSLVRLCVLRSGGVHPHEDGDVDDVLTITMSDDDSAFASSRRCRCLVFVVSL